MAKTIKKWAGFSLGWVLKIIKNIFRQSNTTVYDANFLHIAIHIRRMNHHDKNRLNENANNSVLKGMDVPNNLYLDIISQLSKHYSSSQLKFHIYSQGSENDFKEFQDCKNIIFHLNEKLNMTFKGLVFADVLVTAPSTLSYVAGLISNGQIFYIPFCNPPLPHWNIIKGYESTRMMHEFIIPILTTVNYNPITKKFTKIEI